MKVIVLAGGGGTRLWPLSRENFPKQFLNFGFGLSLLQRTVKRLASAPFVDQLIVATNKHHCSLVHEQLKKIDADCRVIVEPARKNTAAAISLAIKILETEYGTNASDPILVVPSDHLIEPEVLFLNSLEQLNENFLYRNKIITFGIRPTHPETGYGYIEIGNKFNSFTFKALRFVEKPDQKLAEKYVENPHFYWNSGMFLFSAQTFWDQLAAHVPAMSRVFKLDLESVMAQFNELPDLSIDYAMMEKSNDILLYPLAVSWSDVGSWDSVYDAMEKDQDQNVKIGHVITIDTKNCLIMGGKRVISTIGLDDFLIIETEDALLISKKGESQKVKGLLQTLKNSGQSPV